MERQDSGTGVERGSEGRGLTGGVVQGTGEGELAEEGKRTQAEF